MKPEFLVLFLLLLTNYFSSAQTSKQNPQIDKIDILHYDFNVKISDASNEILAEAKVKVLFKENVKEFFLDLKSIEDKKGMSVFKVKSYGENIKFKHFQDKLFLTNDSWLKGDTTIIEIEYGGIPNDGLIISNNKFGKRTFFGDNWPNRAHNWLPVIDHPSDKASVDFEIIAPSHYQVVANGELIEKKEITKAFNYFHYSTKDISLPTKVMVIGAADFETKNYGNVYGIPISSMVFVPAPNNGIDDYLPAMDVMKYFIDSIGPYSYLKLANVQSKTRYGGMENAGNIFYYEASVNGRNMVEPLIAHEVAHQWFGNSATEKNWFDIWLSEGFATYLTDMFLEYKYGEEKLKDRMSKERDKVIRYNTMISKPIIDTTITDWNKLLNPNAYEKGAWFLHMLRQKVGYNNFMKIIRGYYKEYRNGNATTDDFRFIAESISNKNLKPFFNQWLRRPNFPDLNVKWTIKNNLLLIEVEQLKDEFDINLPLRIINYNRDTLDLNIRVANKKESFALPLNKSFKAANSKLFIDPEVILLQRNMVSKEDVHYFKIPIIKNTSLLKKGDLLFQDIDCGPLCDAIESVTYGLDGAHFSHVGIVSQIKEGKIMVIEAIGDKVQETNIDKFLERSKDKFNRPKVVVGRLKNNSIVEKALAKIRGYIGKPYDDEFNIDNDSYYCSELVFLTFLDNKGKKIFKTHPMTYKSSKTAEYFKPWVDYFNKLKIDIPEGKPGINPGGISRSDKLNVIYRFGNPEGW